MYGTRVAMDVTNSDIRVVSYQSNQIKKWTSSPIPAGLIKDGIIQDPGAMSIIVKTLFNSLKLKKSGVTCTITGLPFIYRKISMPGVSRSIKLEAIERTARMEMSVSEEDMYLVWQLIEPHQNAIESEYFVVGVPRKALNPLLATLTGAGIKSSRIEIKPLALARAAALKDTLILSLEKEFIDIVLVNGGRIRVIHSFGNAIKPVDLIGLLNELVDGLNIAIKSFSRDFPQSTFAADTPILISGHLASNDSVMQMVQEATGHPVSILNSTLPIPATLPPELYAASLGLISWRKNGRRRGDFYLDLSLNLLDGLKKRQTRTVRPGYAMAAAAAVLLLIMMLKIYNLKADAAADVGVLEKSISAQTEQLGTSQKSSEEAGALKKSVEEQYLNLDNDLKALKAKNQTIANLKSDFAYYIEIITTAFPENMEFKSISLQKSLITITGTAAESIDVLALADELENNSSLAEVRVKAIEPAEMGGVVFQVIAVKK